MRRNLFALRLLIISIAVMVSWTLVASALGGPEAQSQSQRVDRIIIVKSAREMTLMCRGKPVKTYKVALGTQPVGAKERQGDHKTPEGNYVIDSKVENSRFHRALHISYPSAADRGRARKLGVSPGGDVEIHGLEAKYGWIGSAHRRVDWTDGCVAVTNEEIDEIWPMVPVGTPVEIRP
jgi:murein L,D-transpeptidase YafK